MSEVNGNHAISERVGGYAWAVSRGFNRWRLTWWRSLVGRVNAMEPDMQACSGNQTSDIRQRQTFGDREFTAEAVALSTRQALVLDRPEKNEWR